MKRNSGGIGRTLLFLLSGATVGAVLGVFFAPRSGFRKAREHFGDWLKERREAGEELLHAAKDEKEAVIAAAKAAKHAYAGEYRKHS